MRILVVEDEVDVCNVTAAMITHLGHVAAKSYSAADAFQQLRNGNIDLLVTDICMPDMDGAALVQLVVDDGLLPMKRTVAVTGLDAEDTLVHWMTARNVIVLFKPFSLSALRWAIETATAD